MAAQFAPARELGGDFHDFLMPDSNTLIVALGDVSGKGVPAALYSVFAGELVRGRTFRRRYLPERSSPANVLMSINTILHERQLEEYYCTLCYAVFDLKRRTVTLANSGLPYPVRASGDTTGPIELPGVPLGSFFGVTYDEVTFPLHPRRRVRLLLGRRLRGDERKAGGVHAGPADRGRRTHPPPDGAGDRPRIVEAVAEHRAGFPPNDDMTVVAVKMNETSTDGSKQS